MDAFFATLRPGTMLRIFYLPGHSLGQMDRLVATARKYNLKIMPVLADGANGCGDTGHDDGWYADGYRGTYLNWLRTVVTHFKDEPVIGMWELVNEPIDGNLDALRRFFDTAGGTIHAIDRHHLVSSGTQPPWAYHDVSGYQYLGGSPGIDVLSMHEYDMVPRASCHTDPALQAATAVNKPLIVGEYGVYASPGGDPGEKFNGYACRSWGDRASVVKSKLEDYYSRPGIAGTFYWSFTQDENGRGCNLSVYGNTPNDPMINVIKTVDLRSGG